MYLILLCVFGITLCIRYCFVYLILLCVFDIAFKQKDLLLQYSLKIAYKVHIHLTEGAGQIN